MDMEQFLMQFVTTPVELLAAVVGMLIVLELITLQKIKKMRRSDCAGSCVERLRGRTVRSDKNGGGVILPPFLRLLQTKGI